MVDDVGNLVLEQLRALRADVASVKEDTREIKTRLAVVESGIASLRRDNGALRPALAAQHLSDDRLAEIERRLDRADTS